MAVARLGADGEVVEVLDRLDHAVAVEQHLHRAEIGGAGRDHQVALAESGHHVERRQLASLQILRPQVNQHGAVLAADHDRGDTALDRAEHVAHIDAGQVLDPRLVHVRITDRQHTQRHRPGGIEGQADRRQRVGRQRRQRTLGELVGHGQGGVGIDVVAEIQTDHTGADDRSRLDPGDAGDWLTQRSMRLVIVISTVWAGIPG